MNRRGFLSLGLSSPLFLAAQKGPATPQRVETMRPGPDPAIVLNHVGFLPGARKSVLFRRTDLGAEEFTLRDIGSSPEPFQEKRRFYVVDDDVVPVYGGDFSDVDREGMYQISAGGQLSVPFFIHRDVWRRTLPKAVGYYRYQRCGVEVPNVHPVCHLDDARRRDDGRRVDTTGGWHDAGDLRKWMGSTLLNGIALLRMARNLGDHWDLLDEVRWGNRYFLKMQDTDGLVWADVAGGVNGDNSDNHWTDNRAGTADDRYLNPAKSGFNQALFVTLEAMAAQAYAKSDPAYARTCMDAATRCWQAAKRDTGSAKELAWWTLAAIEMSRHAEVAKYATRLAALQTTEFIGSQKKVRGFWRTSEKDASPYNDAVHSAMPAIALLEAAAALPENPDAARWRDAVRMHLDEYVLPMAARSAYAIIPFGVFTGSPTAELYRPLAGDLTYRYFMPVRKQSWWLGTTSHLECYALLLGMAGAAPGGRAYRALAYRQLEWIMGANPFGACLMTGEGMRNPYPHSRYVGLIPGGIMNGIAGNAKDEPVLDTANGFDWRTTEYWSPHNAWYIWTQSVLDRGVA